MSIKNVVIFSIVLLLNACAAQQIELSDTYWKEKNKKVIVSDIKEPKADFFTTGAQGIMDAAINRVAAKPLIKHIVTEDNHFLEKVALTFSQKLKTKGFKSKALGKQIDVASIPRDRTGLSNHANKDFKLAFSSEKSDQLLVLSILNFGATRNYYGFIPLGAPKTFCALQGELIDLHNNQILWRKTVHVITPIEKPWDQKPNYPNLDKALQVAIKKASTQLEQAFFKA